MHPSQDDNGSKGKAETTGAKTKTEKSNQQCKDSVCVCQLIAEGNSFEAPI